MDFFLRLFESDFMPHGHCYLWRPEILWLHVISDAIIALAYFSIPLALMQFIRQRRDMNFGYVFYAFSAFILFCGVSHAIGIYNVWHGAYRFEGVVKGATAFASVATALLLWPLIPKALAIPNGRDLERINGELNQEIERRAAAEDALRELAGHLEETVQRRTRELAFRSSLLDRCADAVIAWDRGTKQIVFWNEGATRLFGYDSAEVTSLRGAAAANLLHAELPSGLSELQEALAQDKDWAGDVWCERKGGVRIVVAVRFQKIEDESGRAQVLAVARDATQRHEAERLLAHANDELSQFAHVAAHDLSSPIRTVAGLVELVRDRYGEELADDAVEMLDMAIGSAHRMQMLIADLLQYARAGQPESSERTSLESIVAEIESDLSDEIASSGATIECAPMPGFYAPPRALRQVVQNLITNALKYSEGQPRIRISSESGSGPMATVRVSDNGIGIEPRYHQKIFQVFQRLHREQEYQGTGVGLSTVKRGVESWGGTVGLESAVGEGSTFFFTLPIAR